MIRYHDSRTGRMPCSAQPCGPRGSTDRAHPDHPIVLADNEEEDRGDGPCATFGGLTIGEVFRHVRQVLESTSKKGRTVATNNLRSHEAEELRKPIGEKGVAILTLVYVTCARI
jgi:hypothetical protein